ncbi:hypothetical protein TanjilG_08665 [Lupinus angustifolius]|uniref:Uncharacterized protein n=1 Tax=Lupinus angustifolius TaxID=3871 RepID=A0A4P1QWZ7_LUPAN|nr:hypothetical protein TanjilG_08665 [Lupinus angustifolius]
MSFHVVAIFLLLVRTNANSEGDALYAFRKAVKDPNNVLNSWDPTLVDPCTWFHVTCDNHNRVTRLYVINKKHVFQLLGLLGLIICYVMLCRDLGHAKLSGYLVPQLGRLQHLQFLELYKNELVGPIPKELGRLKNLVSLGLYHNNLTGSIPSSFSNLSNLKFLRLNSNRLSGRIPRELAKLGNLKILDLSNNDLCGTFPTFGSFSKFPEQSLKNNPRLEGPELMGLVRYDDDGLCK